MRFSKALLLLGTAVTLSACQTITSVFDVVDEAAGNITGAALGSQEKTHGDPATAFASHCPEIIIVDELKSLSEFSSKSSTREKDLVSRVDMEKMDAACKLLDDNVTIDLKLAFNSELGNKAKIRKNDKPFFAYPFFVAVTDLRGSILAKEVFAASVSYNQNETAHTYYENIRQIIPLTRRMNAKSYKIFLGFQLSDEQLAYNRKNLKPTATPQAQKQTPLIPTEDLPHNSSAPVSLQIQE